MVCLWKSTLVRHDESQWSYLSVGAFMLYMIDVIWRYDGVRAGLLFSYLKGSAIMGTCMRLHVVYLHMRFMHLRQAHNGLFMCGAHMASMCGTCAYGIYACGNTYVIYVSVMKTLEDMEV